MLSSLSEYSFDLKLRSNNIIIYIHSIEENVNHLLKDAILLDKYQLRILERIFCFKSNFDFFLQSYQEEIECMKMKDETMATTFMAIQDELNKLTQEKKVCIFEIIKVS